MKYCDRKAAGQVLVKSLESYANRKDVIVFALPRGGVPVAYEVATKLGVTLDVLVVRKLGVPEHEELAMGAIASGGIVIMNTELVQSLQISQSAIDDVLQMEQAELTRREYLYRGNRPLSHVPGKTIILVDDGIATGATIKAAIAVLKQQNPAEIIIAVPVAPPSVYKEMEGLVTTIICPLQPLHFQAVGLWYENFLPTTDEEVTYLLEKSSSMS